MEASAEHLRFILGLKLKNLRHDRKLALKELAQRAGLSISYLSEIEKGKKYPKPGKLLQLANALDVPFDELVTMSVDSELAPLKQIFGSTLIQEFPFELFGLASQDLFSLITYDPGKAVALAHTFLDIGRTYDVQIEHFLFAALRSFQQMKGNHLEELEETARGFRTAEGWPVDDPIDEAALRGILETRYGYVIDQETLADHPDLRSFRSVFQGGSTPTLYINRKLKPIQRAFVYGREIGFRHLGLKERPRTSSWIKAESFEQVLNNFKASYFAGALLIDGECLREDLSTFFQRRRWDDGAFLDMLERSHGTQEMFFYRLTQIVPAFFSLRDIYFVRFHDEASGDRFRLTKVLNLAHVAVPYGMAYSEHYCRRWPAMKLLRDLAEGQPYSEAPSPRVSVQRSRFIDEDAEFFVITLARPLSLSHIENTSVSLGFLVDDAFKQTVRFWDDPSVPQVEVNLTCERCPLSHDQCQDRVAPPTIYDAEQAQARKEAAMAKLTQGANGQ